MAHSSATNEQRLALVCCQADCSRDVAFAALSLGNWDVVDALIYLFEPETNLWSESEKIELIISAKACDEQEAVNALQNNMWDVVDALLSFTIENGKDFDSKVVGEEGNDSKSVDLLSPKGKQTSYRYFYPCGAPVLSGDVVEYKGTLYTVISGSGGRYVENPQVLIKSAENAKPSSPCVKQLSLVSRKP